MVIIQNGFYAFRMVFCIYFKDAEYKDSIFKSRFNIGESLSHQNLGHHPKSYGLRNIQAEGLIQ